MAIRFIREVFPEAKVEWTRGASYNGNPYGKLVVTEKASGRVVSSVTQKEVSDEYYGEGAETLKADLRKHAGPSSPFF